MSLIKILQDLTELTKVDFTWKQPIDSPLQKEIGDMTHRSEFCNQIKLKNNGLSKCIYDCSDGIHYTNREELVIRKSCHAGAQLICRRIFLEGEYLGSLMIGPFAEKKEKNEFGVPYIDEDSLHKIFEIVTEITPLIIEKVMLKIRNGAVSKQNHKISKIIEYIDKNFSQNITIEKLSFECHLSGYRLMHLFKQEMKKTIFQYLMEYRINKSCEFLTATNLKVGEIAALVGFQSTNFFNTKFKLLKKNTPLEYRNKNYVSPNP